VDTVEELTDREQRLLNAAVSAAVKARTNRALVWGLIAGASLMAAIGIPVTYALTTEAQNSRYDALQQRVIGNREKAVRSCRLVTELAHVQAETVEQQAGESERFMRESKDRFGLSPQRFHELVKRGQTRERRRLEAIRAVAASSCLPA